VSTKPTNTPSTTSSQKSPFGEITPEDLRVTQHDWDYLASAIHHIRVDTHGFSFFGSMLQTIAIDFSSRIPTACISYQIQKKQFLIELNPAFFRLLTLEERMAILLHEVYHMTHSHLTRIPALEHKMKANYAADAAINQLIPGIPNREPIKAVLPENYGLEKDKTLEFYYENWPESPEDENGNDPNDPNGSGASKTGGAGKGHPIDVHDWDPNVEESDVLDSMEDVIKRTMIKTNSGSNKLPASIQDLLESIEKRRKVINWQRMIKSFVKRTTSGVDKEYTRMRPSKRYDYASPGLRLGEVPKLLILEDTSGSMSTIEINAGLDQIDQILKVGAKKVSLGLWHTDLYKVLKYKKGMRSEVHKTVESGGTDFEPCAQYINKMKPDAVIVFTDGYYSATETRVDIPILFVICSQGVSELTTKYPRQRMVKLPPMGE
jgi:predicted metal-dependent peptidase